MLNFPEVLLAEDIKKIIPHRYPFLLIDKVESVFVGKSCVAYKNVTNNEWFFQGHFPDFPVMPGVLIIESMAQAAGVLAFMTLFSEGVCAPGKSDRVYFTAIEEAKFRKPVIPGDVLKLDVSVIKRRGNKFWSFCALASVNNLTTDSAEFNAMIPDVRHKK
ncbi:3-hydroxyacyl-[acyl-carrier-protein] dehydratase FabZ [Alphaproteobacteria bacterium]|nr:3-hydroxyacyl-[acyl-carrier-protein] dehydratase FabZ [Alphaproteobacteria bacterium]